jgi:CubicO group peptidase (beta-lactamase class C family)
MNHASLRLTYVFATTLLLSPLFNRVTPAAHLVETSLEVTDSAPLYFPPLTGDWETIDPAQVGWDPAALEKALQFAGEHKSSGVVILVRGRLLAERYWKLPVWSNLLARPTPYILSLHERNSAGHQIEDVASVQKSVVAVLAGIAQQKGLLKITDHVDRHLGVGWSQAPEETETQITLRHLLTMTSGLDTHLKSVAPPGTKWRYNTTAYSQSLKVVAAAAHLQPDELTQKWLTGPIGMTDSRWVPRPYVKTLRVDANTVGFATTARDLARFGLLILAEGKWGEKVIVEDRAYLRAMLQPSQQLNR